MKRFSILTVMFLVLAVGAVALYLGQPGQAGSASSGRDSWKMFPDDVIAVVHADVAALAKTELYRTLIANYGDQPMSAGVQYEEFVTATGFDLQNDLKTITLGVGGDFADDSPPFYMLVTGTFDREKISAYILENTEYEQVEREGLVAYAPRAAGVDSEATVAWLDEGTLLISSTPEFSRLVASVAGKGSNAARSKLGGLLGEADGQLYLAMMVPEDQGAGAADGAPPTVQNVMQSMQQSPLGQLKSFMLTLDAGLGLDLALHAEANSEDNGMLIHDMLNGYMAMGRMMGADNPQLTSVLEHVKLERTGAKVQLKISMSSTELSAAIESGKAQAIIGG